VNRAPDHDLVDRYFAGDLDRVEIRAFEQRLDDDDAFRARFEADYDARTAEDPWAGIATETIELDECFSPDTLERYVADELDAEDRALVEGHIACPWCRGQVEAIRALKERDDDDRNTIRGEDESAPDNVVPLPRTKTTVRDAPEPADDPTDAHAAQSPSPWAWASLPPIAAAAMLVVKGFIPPPPPIFELEVITTATEQYRSASAQLGDELQLAIDDVAGRSAALRVYLQGVGLVLECPETEPEAEAESGAVEVPPAPRVPNAEPSDPLAEALRAARPPRPEGQCRPSKNTVGASLKMTARGTYEVIFIVADAPIPPPTDDIDDDIAAAPDGHLKFETVEVR
jgi:hypothetical protein